jgi:hypothetical protein
MILTITIKKTALASRFFNIDFSTTASKTDLKETTRDTVAQKGII